MIIGDLFGCGAVLWIELELAVCLAQNFDKEFRRLLEMTRESERNTANG